MRRLVISCFMLISLAGCSNISNMFSGSGQERPFDTVTAPDTKDVLKAKPEGLLADSENAQHTGMPLQPE